MIQTPTRPIVRYHGGKWLLAPWIIQHFPPHRVYVEPFGGGGSVLMRKARTYAEVYNDLDGEMVSLFRMVRDHGEDLKRLIELTPFSRDDYRQSFEYTDNELEQARRTVVRSFMGFGSNALCRTVKSGFRSCSNRSGTTPAHDWRNYPDALVWIVERLRGVVLENRDAKGVMAAHDTDKTLHYCDPPYVHETRSTKMHGHHGYTHEMSDDEHEDLAAFLGTLKGHVVVSGYECELYDRLYAGWRRVERAALADGARPRKEVLWITAHTPTYELPLLDMSNANLHRTKMAGDNVEDSR